MKVLKILIVMLILIMSVGAVCAAESITEDAIGDDSKEILETVQDVGGGGLRSRKHHRQYNKQ